MGIVQPYKTDSEVQGRIAVTGRDADGFSFKVPTLRNVELTYPYFHDGAVRTLEQATDVMARVQLGRTVTEEEIGSIVAFLKTLTGDQPQFQIPILPPFTPATPPPQTLCQAGGLKPESLHSLRRALSFSSKPLPRPPPAPPGSQAG